jgi:hypothetical protein
MKERNGGARFRIDHPNNAPQMLCKRFDYSCAQPGLRVVRPAGHSYTVVADRQSPVRAIRAVINRDRAVAGFWEGVLKGVDDQFGNNQP